VAAVSGVNKEKPQSVPASGIGRYENKISILKGGQIMAELVTTHQTALPGDEVLVRGVQFFTNEKWRVQTQSARTATFVGRPGVPWVRIILGIGFVLVGVLLSMTGFGAIIGIPLIIVGIILSVGARIRMLGFLWGSQNLVVSVTPMNGATEVSVTGSKQAKKVVDRFLGLLPPAEIESESK
jgi:hypothetical protein